MKKKNLFVVLIAFLCVCTTAFALVGCGESDYKVNFIVDGKVYEAVSTSGNEALNLPSDPEKPGYVFDGWYKDKDEWKQPFTSDSLSDTALSSDMSVYAKFEKFDAEKATQAEFTGFEKTGEYEYYKKVPNDVETLSLTEVVGIDSRSSWVAAYDLSCTKVILSKIVELSAGDNKCYVNVTAADGTMRMYTLNIRRRAMCTVTFADCDVKEQTVEEDSCATAPGPAKRTGYTFEKWDFDFTSPIVENTIVKAVWTPIDYSINYELNGGESNSGNAATYTVEDEITLEKPTRENYEFKGWFTDEALTEEVRKIKKGTTGKKKFFAKWLCIYSYSDNTITGLTDYGETLTALNIPSRIEGEVINKIGGSAFARNGNLETVTISDGLTTICAYAFMKCTRLKNVIIGSGVTFISGSAFAGCSELTSVTIPDGVTSIEAETFSGCTKLSEVTIPKSVTSIGDFAFSDCASLTNISIRNVVTRIGACAFKDCSGLKSVTIPNSVKYVDQRAFENCTGLTNVAIPSGMTGLNYGMFNGCTGLKSVFISDSVKYIDREVFKDCTGLTRVTFGKNVQSIGEFAFSGCTSLTGVTIGEGVKKIRQSAFSGCAGLMRVVIPDNVESIESCAFRSCSRLTSVTLGKGVTSVGDDAFVFCYKLVEIINNSNLEVSATGFVNDVDAGFSALSVKKGGTTDVVNKDGYLFITVDGVNYLFGYLGNDTILTLPENYDGKNYRISDKAFFECINLMSVTIPSAVTGISDNAFVGCYKLAEVINNSNLNIVKGNRDNGRVGYNALSVKKGGSTDIVNKDGYLFITVDGVNYLFGYTGSDTELTLPENYNGANYEIGKYAFYKRTGLTSVTIPDGVTNIGDGAFYGCTALTSVTIGNGVMSIGESAFGSCLSLRKIYYKGTGQEWDSIVKGVGCFPGSGEYTVVYNA